ncbi:hypothetical protein ACQEVC_34215 [Plantactinospora sp. CA-294935]|uniref:hypothetical protein n=1 Tax=Plantactinospora sp. CA-294935 TaxID=3240012 RepID=UPI003D8BB793
MAPTIYPEDRADAKNLAQRLLDAAGPERRDEVRTTSDGPAGVGFEVPEDLVEKVLGYELVDLDEDEPASDEPPAEHPAAEEPAAAEPPAGSPAAEELAVPAASEESTVAAEAAEEKTSAGDGAGEFEVSAKPAGGSSRPVKASRARAGRST